MRRGIIAIVLLVAAVGAGADMTWNAHTKELGVQVAPLPEQRELIDRVSPLVPPWPPAGMVACWWGRAGFCCREGEPIACIRFMGPKKTPHYKRLS